MQAFSAASFTTQAFSPQAFAFGLTTAVATPEPLGGARIRRAGGKRRILTPDPILELLQTELEDEIAAQQQTATQAQFAGRPKRTRATREKEFFSLLH